MHCCSLVCKATWKLLPLSNYVNTRSAPPSLPHRLRLGHSIRTHLHAGAMSLLSFFEPVESPHSPGARRNRSRSPSPNPRHQKLSRGDRSDNDNLIDDEHEWTPEYPHPCEFQSVRDEQGRWIFREYYENHDPGLTFLSSSFYHNKIWRQRPLCYDPERVSPARYFCSDLSEY